MATLDASYSFPRLGSRLKPNLPLPTRHALSEYTSLDLLPGSEQGDLTAVTYIHTYIHTYRNGPRKYIIGLGIGACLSHR